MKQKVTRIVFGTIMAGALLGSGRLPAQGAQTAPDNTSANKQDQNSQSPNADKATNHVSDRQTMAHIRRDIVKNKSLSTYAHNVKIISVNGKVTLRGPVRSDEEKQAIEQYAKKYAGDQNVTDELTVKGAQ